LSGRTRGSRIALACLPPLALLGAGGARAECDPGVVWSVYPPTGDVAEIVVEGETAWIGAEGGVVRVELGGVASGSPTQSKITDREGLVSTRVSALARDAFGNLWVGTRASGISIFDASGAHVADLSSFGHLYSDLVLAISGRGNRMVVSGANEFSPQGNPEGGGFVVVNVAPADGGGHTFTTAPGENGPVDVARAIHVAEDAVWFGTSGSGLWVRDESVVPAVLRQQLTQSQGLASNNVKKIVEGPRFPTGSPVLWLGTGAGLQSYDPSDGSIETVGDLAGENILDLYLTGTTLWVLAEAGTSRDLYRLELASAPAAVRIPRADCPGDTLYVPRQAAVDAAGRIVLGTLANGYLVREGLSWYCPPPLGPHHPQAAGLALHPDGTLYFGTGDKERLFPGNGVGVFDGQAWTSITRDDGIVDTNMTELLVWGDGSVWMGTTTDRNNGGLDRYFPSGGAIETYHNTVQVPSRRTQGRAVRALETDAQGNLWVCYGQTNPSGGLSVIEAPPSLRVTNYDFGTLFFGTPLLRDMAFDSQGVIWVVTHTTTLDPAQLYLLDPAGTPADAGDDRTFAYSVPNEIFDLGECKDIEIDGSDRVWIAGAKGLALGERVPGVWPPRATWTRVVPTASQAGGRNPLPYEVAALDWEDNLWLGTENAGLVRVSKDLATWTWFDQIEGCPLPDQAIRGVHIDDAARHVWVGTATGGLARLDLTGARSPGRGEALDPEPYPNPWSLGTGSGLRFAGIPPDQTVDLRIFTIGGELVHEQRAARGEKVWDGTNVGGLLVQAGVYVVTAEATSGATYRGKVAVLR
jgi:ligand-binding sensor domain-containing protein